eukprot:TRINITY_DN4987_c0_g1_i2.p1 TRINITY_DN4987_c0_g1~~TRINITY_DN4987_c0_g1_i2.p1  ORF type:complete len:292 (-),score=130.73 TRINITY_DN4987_c0_g1_i2:876-1751(-)
MLLSNNILSSPVWDEASSSFTGIIDIMDILMLMSEVFSRQELESFCSLDMIATHAGRFTPEAFQEHFRNHRAFLQGAVITDMGGLSGVNRFVPVKVGDSLWDVLNVMVDNKLHRVAVLQGDSQVVNYVTQSRLIHFLVEHEQLVPEAIRSKTIEELEIFSSEVLTCSEKDRAVDVFAKMSRAGVSAIPILSEEGTFSGCLSASDLKGIGKDCSNFARLGLPVLDYIAPIRQENLKAKFPAIGCNVHTPFERVIKKLDASRVHRVFITDDDNKIVGVVSLGDVLRVVRDAAV